MASNSTPGRSLELLHPCGCGPPNLDHLGEPGQRVPGLFQPRVQPAGSGVLYLADGNRVRLALGAGVAAGVAVLAVLLAILAVRRRRRVPAGTAPYPPGFPGAPPPEWPAPGS